MMEVNLDTIKLVLEEKKINILERISKLENNKRRSGGALSADSSEQSIEIQNDEVVDTMEKIENLELNQISKALSALSDGSYGICHDCGEVISSSRLIAVPLTTMCLECAK